MFWQRSSLYICTLEKEHLQQHNHCTLVICIMQCDFEVSIYFIIKLTKLIFRDLLISCTRYRQITHRQKNPVLMLTQVPPFSHTCPPAQWSISDSHLSPVHGALHEHSYPEVDTRSVHVPPCWHGFSSHGEISVWKDSNTRCCIWPGSRDFTPLKS